jgi:hypothetical protein
MLPTYRCSFHLAHLQESLHVLGLSNILVEIAHDTIEFLQGTCKIVMVWVAWTSFLQQVLKAKVSFGTMPCDRQADTTCVAWSTYTNQQDIARDALHRHD